MSVSLRKGVLRISSGNVGTERILVIRRPDGNLEINNNADRNLWSIRPNANVTFISFDGDDDRDIFINATEINSHLRGHGCDDLLIGGDGEDTLVGGTGRDDLQGGGNDDESYPGDDLFEGTMEGGYGSNLLELKKFTVKYLGITLTLFTQIFDSVNACSIVDVQTPY